MEQQKIEANMREKKSVHLRKEVTEDGGRCACGD
jgi:hypothetical protein